VRKHIRILLEKSLHWNEQNLLMLERLGVQNEWRDKSKLAFAKLQKMLDPAFKFESADPSAPAPAAAPPTPQAPDGRPGVSPGAPQPDRERKEKPQPQPGMERQIL